jgi:hypothetical protein
MYCFEFQSFFGFDIRTSDNLRLFRPDMIKRCGVNGYGKCFHINNIYICCFRIKAIYNFQTETLPEADISMTFDELQQTIIKRKKELGILETEAMIESLRNKGENRTPEKRFALKQAEERAKMAGKPPIKAY